MIRAAIAGAAVSVAWLAGRLRDAWHLLLVAACVLLAWNPYSLFDAGFQLSFGAVAAIFVLGGPFLRVLDGYPMPRVAARGARDLGGVHARHRADSLARVRPGSALRRGGERAGRAGGAGVARPVVLRRCGRAVCAGIAATLAWASGWVAVYIESCARAASSLPGAQVSGRAAAAAAAAALGGIAISWRRLRRAARP